MRVREVGAGEREARLLGVPPGGGAASASRRPERASRPSGRPRRSRIPASAARGAPARASRRASRASAFARAAVSSGSGCMAGLRPDRVGTIPAVRRCGRPDEQKPGRDGPARAREGRVVWVAIGLKALGALLVLATLLPFLPSNSGFIRTFDFPRLQIAALIVPVALGLLVAAQDATGLTLVAGLAAALAYQVACIYPFTRLVSPQAAVAAPGACHAQARVSILIANVLESNRAYARTLDLVAARDPDLLLLVETDAGWAEALEPLRARYPHVVAQPQGNTYGLMFYSKLPLTDPQVRFLLQDDVPSVRTGVTLRSGERFTFYGVHPRPPHPGQSSAPRDAELVLVAREVKAGGVPPWWRATSTTSPGRRPTTCSSVSAGSSIPASGAASTRPSTPIGRCCAGPSTTCSSAMISCSAGSSGWRPSVRTTSRS